MSAEQLVVRFDTKTKEAIDAFREERERSEPGMRVTRTDAIRILIARGLEAVKTPAK